MHKKERLNNHSETIKRERLTRKIQCSEASSYQDSENQVNCTAAFYSGIFEYFRYRATVQHLSDPITLNCYLVEDFSPHTIQSITNYVFTRISLRFMAYHSASIIPTRARLIDQLLLLLYATIPTNSLWAIWCPLHTGRVLVIGNTTKGPFSSRCVREQVVLSRHCRQGYRRCLRLPTSNCWRNRKSRNFQCPSAKTSSREW